MKYSDGGGVYFKSYSEQKKRIDVNPEDNTLSDVFFG